ncbi:hypothetical protein EW146_g9487 [Bondarzewia mesenterica]|uniref:Uncharacterized protein n=1 Tax=Bondarzewia mesenterica TaxID=1095465 RepID=A0A4S4L5U4_9AGAM|nr:hypothetical protein EW146_g9487 [Bondarzewia mesenterica]
MLSPFEHTKWPQAYFNRKPHNIAAPMNPDLLNFNISDERGPGPTFPLGPSHSITKFDDVDIPWVMFSPAQFVVSQDLPSAQVSTLCNELLRRMCTSMTEVKQMSELIGCKQMTGNTSLDRHALASRVANYKYQAYRSACLYRAYTQLTQVPMSTFDTLLWFWEFQRILLDIRSWIIYMEVVKLRWDNPGVITSNIALVKHMLHIRIPVWLLQPAHTVTTNMLIERVKTVVQSGIHFSTSRTMRHGVHTAEAPLWMEAEHEDRSNIQEIVRHLCLTSQPTLRPLKAYSPMDMTSVAQSQASQKSDAALVHLQADVTDCSPHDVLDVIIDTPVEWVELIAAHNEKLYGGDFHPMGDMPVQAAPNMPVQKVAAHSQPIGLHAAWVSGNPSSSSSGASQNTAPSSQLPGASQLSGLKGSLKKAGAKPTQASQDFHNWLRIRIWAYSQVINPPENKKVCMIKAEWAIAVEGRYYSIDVDASSAVQLKATADEIARLPLPPLKEKRS